MKYKLNIVYCFVLFALASCKNAVPECEITNLQDSTAINSSGEFVVFVDANDPDGKVFNVKLYIDDKKVKTEYQFPYSFLLNANDISEGFHTLKVIVRDNFFKKISCTKTIFLNPHDLAYVSGNSFMMGNSNGDFDERPAHIVRLNSYYLGKYEVTNAEYVHFLNSIQIDSAFQHEDHTLYYPDLDGSYIIPEEDGFQVLNGYEDFPVVNVTWYGAEEYCRWAGGRLPTEAEYEYAARGGAYQDTIFTYAGSNNPLEVGWCWENAGESILNIMDNKGFFKTGKKKPNSLGLYDMSGNVWEWCQDWYISDYYKNSQLINPLGPSEGNKKVIRGGGWMFSCDVMNVSNRLQRHPETAYPYMGFRICFPLK